ncbi:MAG: hypothetical protein NT090_03370 [Acidobacteria bacterium]|nr:hypothetical protein [Acidobacteriota bacterium]
MPENICRATYSLWATVIMTLAVSLFAKPSLVSELEGLVYGLTPLPWEGRLPLLKRPIFRAAAAAALFVAFNIIFW